MDEVEHAITQSKRKLSMVDIIVGTNFIYSPVFGLLYFFVYKNSVLGWLHVFDFVSITALYIYYRITFNKSLFFSLIYVQGVINLVVIALMGGNENTGLFAAFPFLLFIVFIANSTKMGIFMCAVLFGSYAILLPLSFLKIITLPYSLLFYGSFVTILMLCSMIIYGYIILKSRLDKLVTQKTSETLDANEQLKKRSLELEMKTEELERINKLMIGRELAMTKMKEEMEQLKKQTATVH